MKYMIKEERKAIQWLGDSVNPKECWEFCPLIMAETYRCNNRLIFKNPGYFGKTRVELNDWIVKVSDSEYLVFSNEDFKKRYISETELRDMFC